MLLPRAPLLRPPIGSAAFLNLKFGANGSLGDGVQMEESVEGDSSGEGSHVTLML